MRLRPTRLLRELSGRSNADLTQQLLLQVQASIEGAETALRAASGELPTEAAREDIAVIEHRGDDARELLISSLALSLVTPFDREDMFRVSRSIDDVLDNIQDFVRELDLFQTPGDLFAPVIDAISEGLQMLYKAIEGVVGASDQVELRTLAAKKSGNDIRRNYQEQMARLLHGPVSAEMLRRRELLRRLDVVGLRLGEAVDALADAVIKRSM